MQSRVALLVLAALTALQSIPGFAQPGGETSAERGTGDRSAPWVIEKPSDWNGRLLLYGPRLVAGRP